MEREWNAWVTKGWTEKGWYMNKVEIDKERREEELYAKATSARKWGDPGKKNAEEACCGKTWWRGEEQEQRVCVRSVILRMPAKYSLGRTIEVLGWKSVPIWVTYA